MIVYDQQHHSLSLGAVVGRGGEAVVYRMEGHPERLAKIYEPAARPEYVDKLAWMIAHAPANPTRKLEHPALAWPDALLFDAQDHLRGYSMPFIRRTAPVLDVFNPRRRALVMPPFFDRRYLHRVARNLSSALNALHRSGYVAGDLNESNVLVTHTALVSLIDTDSFQVNAESASGKVVYPCPVGKLEYTPPELQGQRLAEVVRQPEQDSFGLAVLIFQLLMDGNHPFRAQWLASGEPPPIEKRIAQGAFPYTAGQNGLVLPPKNAPELNWLDPWLVELMRRCFLDGHQHPERRPTAEMWRDAIIKAEKNLKTCPVGHHYANHLADCPYCAAHQPAPRAAAGRSSYTPRPAAQASVGGSAAFGPNRSPRSAGSGAVGSASTAPPPNPGSAAGGAYRTRPAAPVNTNFQARVKNRPAAGSIGRNAYPGAAGQSVRIPSSSSVMGAFARQAAPQVRAYLASRLRAQMAPMVHSQAAPWVYTQSPSTLTWNSAPARSPFSIRRLGVRAWLRQQLSHSFLDGGARGALFGMLPGLLLGLLAVTSAGVLNWATCFALGGAMAGLVIGWQPGWRVASLIERMIGWQLFWRGAGMLLGAGMGLAVGIVFFWAVFPLFLGPIFGGWAGYKLGEKVWLSGRSLGWQRIWAALGALSTAGFGWAIAALLGSTGISIEAGANIALLLEYGGVRPLLTAILSGGFVSALGGLLAGITANLAAGLLGLAD